MTVEENSESEFRKAGEKPVDDSGEKQVEEGHNWRKIKDGVPLRHVSYPHAPFRREVEQ